jgi:hypothetical protein
VNADLHVGSFLIGLLRQIGLLGQFGPAAALGNPRVTDADRRCGDPMVLAIVSLALTDLKAAAAGGPLRGYGP